MATYIDNTAANAFVDAAASLAVYAGTDAGSTPYYIVVTDSAGKTNTGYLGAAGAGETASEKLTDGGLENWTSATNLTSWTEAVVGTSTVNQETVNMRTGAACVRLDINAAGNEAVLAQSVTLVASGIYRVSVWYKTAAGKTAAIRIYSGSNVWLKSDGTWATVQTNITLPAATTWTNYVLYFNAHASYTAYTFYFRSLSAASSSVYFDDISLVRIDDPDSTGLHVFNDADSSVRGWKTTDSGFDPILISSYSVFSTIPNISSIASIGGISTVISI